MSEDIEMMTKELPLNFGGSVAKSCKNVKMLLVFGKRSIAMISFKGRHFAKKLILMVVRWYVAYPLSYRNVEELMKERGLSLDHATAQRWVVKYAPQLEKEFSKKHKRQSGGSWRMDETYIKVKGEWHYLYRAVDKEGDTIDFMLSKKRDRKAALRFFKKAIGSNGLPDTVTMYPLNIVG